MPEAFCRWQLIKISKIGALMIGYFRSVNHNPTIKERPELMPGSWIRCEQPNENEKLALIELGIDDDVLNDALDPHEVPRVELTGDWIYFITRLPDVNNNLNNFTSPILFALDSQYIATVSKNPLDGLWQPFIERTTAPTTQQTKLFMLMVDAIALQYRQQVARINRQMRALTSGVHNLSTKDIAKLSEYERTLNDYLDALIPTNTAIEKLLGGRLLLLYEQDRDIVEDLSIDLEQLIARCKSLLRTITNLRDSYRTVMNTRLNETMRLLTVITVGLTIPTMLAGLFGMNVVLPVDRDSSQTFWMIIGMSAVFALPLGYYFLKRR